MSVAFLRSIRVWLTLWYLLLLAAILAAFSAGVYVALRESLYSNLDDSLESRTDLLAGVVAYEEGRPTLAGVDIAGDPDELENFARVYDRDGAVTFDSSPAGAGVPSDPEAVASALKGREVTATAWVNGDALRVRFVPLRREGDVTGALEAGLPEDDVRDTLSTLLLIIAVAYPLTLAATSAGGAFLAGRALSPIDDLTRLAKRITAEDLSQRLELGAAEDEVGRLARTFNEMIARLDEAFRRQREFTADASHELRTPLTAIKGQAEVALQRERDPEAYREVLRAINGEVDRMIRLVGSLLTLARADAGQIPLVREPVGLAGLVAAAVDHVRPAAAQKDVGVEAGGGPDITLNADEDLLLQLLLNLLDNAVKYTPPGGKVAVAWSQDDGRVALRVTDTGAGIPPEEVGRIFDRFYRVDRARSRSEGGSGLGLSISRWIAEAHGGSIEAESEPGKGSTFTVRLPVS